MRRESCEGQECPRPTSSVWVLALDGNNVLPSKRKGFLRGVSRDAKGNRGLNGWVWGEVNTGGRKRERPYQALSPKGALATQHGFPVRDLLAEIPSPWTIQAFQIRHRFWLVWSPMYTFTVLRIHTSIINLPASVHFAEKRGPKKIIIDVHL